MLFNLYYIYLHFYLICLDFTLILLELFMETIQYSLKTNTAYSIDLKSTIRTGNNRKELPITQIYPHSNPILNKKITLHNNNHKSKPNKNDIFDQDCIETYGRKTCILFDLDDDNIEIRLLDNIYQLKYTRKNKLYNIIPSLLEKLYTVVLVEKIQKTNTKEIVAIHFPSK